MLKNKETGTTNKMGDLSTLIGKGSYFEGNISVQHGLRIDGKVKGNIKSSDSVILGKEGEIDGEIEAQNAVIGGKVNGKVIASGKVTLESTSVLKGELKANKLVIDEGSVFDGSSEMSENKSKKGLKAVDDKPDEKEKESKPEIPQLGQ